MLSAEERVMGTFKRSVVLAVAFVGLAVGTARAQERLVAKIPFPFIVRGEQLPAGSYEIVDNQGMITIEGTDSRDLAAAAVAMGTPASGQDPQGRQPALVFIHSENQYTLSQIWESDAKGLAVLSRSDRKHHVAALRPVSGSLTVVSAASM
jgi:hypothetical protein